MTALQSSSPPPPLPPLLMLLLLLPLFVARFNSVAATLSITRHHQGDMFDVSDVTCSMETCVGVSSGTAIQVDGGMGMDDPMSFSVGNRGKQQSTGSSTTASLTNVGCRCQCVRPMPVFRDDLRICVDDLQECSLASFVSGTTVQKIPYVFLPLQGQIVYPSAEIKIAGMQYPICAISKAKYLTRGGWVNFKNQSEFETPFQIHRENGHIMLLWLGDLQSRANIEGRLVLIEMICKETLPHDYDNFHQAITPCISFRIAGTPSVKEVLFSADIRTMDNTPSSGLTISELIAVAICSILLGLMYVASILLYLHVRKGRPKGRNGDLEAFKNPLMSNGITEEGIIKNNPLLQHNGYNDNEAYESDEDRNYSPQGEPSMDMTENNNNNRNLTTAIVHPIQSYNSCISHSMYYSDSNSIEKHPEEDISIVETLDSKEDRLDNIRTIVCANPRKKLYFNPDYFELELLMAPPPAALEFLEKIREVIQEAKRKISMKKFTPNLIVIPEDVNEDTDEQLNSCNKCKTQFKIKSATIQKWLMDVPTTEVTSKPKKNQAPRAPVEALEGSINGVLETGNAERQPNQTELKSNRDEDDEDDDDEEEEGMNIECDSLERSMKYRRNSGYHTPSDYGDVRPDLSPVLSNSALPLEEELTVRTTYTYDTITRKENYYEHISGPDCVREKPKKEILPDILNRASSERYSLVSEVYVNDSFNNNAGASPTNSLDNKKIKKNGPGRIIIEVEECPDDLPTEDSDSFEPDTLDRNSCAKFKPKMKTAYSSDSLEQQQSLGGNPTAVVNNGFGSLLEIYEAKSVMADVQKRWNQMNRTDTGYLKPDPKHCRRQRCPSPISVPKPSKNVCVRSTSKHGAMQLDCVRSRYNRRTHEIMAGASEKQTVQSSPIDHNKYEDSGYLSTESSESFGKVMTTSQQDTDESGAESIDTDFKFFKTRTDRNYCDW